MVLPLRALVAAVTLLLMLVALGATAAPSPAAAKKKPSSQGACKTKKTKAKRTRTCVKTTRRCTTARCTTTRRTCTTTTRLKGSKKARKPRTVCKKKVTRKPVGVPGTPAPVAPSGVDLSVRDYTKIPGLSQPTFTDIERLVVPFTTQDGTDLHIEVVKPKGATNLGVILESSPYHGTLYERTGTRILPLPLDGEGNPVGLTGYYPQRGYAVVMMDLRGTGKSGGCLNHLGTEDQTDLKEVIEWAASQPWSNGRVGMTGHSYVGSTPMIATKLNPRGLVTIVPSAGLAAMYDHQFQGGVPFYLQLAGPVYGYQSLAVDSQLPPIGENPVSGGQTGDDFGGGPQKALCGAPDNAATQGAGIYFGQESDWHRERDARKEATAWKGHVFLVHGVNDEAARISAMDWFTQRGGRAGDKLWIGQWDHGIGCCPNQRGIQWTEALHAWFDRQLLQKDVDTGPPVEAFLNDEPRVEDAATSRKEIQTQAAWPGRTRELVFGTGSAGTLVEGSAGEPGGITFAGTPEAFTDPTGSSSAAQFETQPFKDDLLLLGVPKLDLAATITTPRVDLIGTLYVRKDETLRRITQWSINPLLREGAATITPVVPGARIDLDPPAFPIAHHVRKGTTLVLRVTTSDPDKVPWAATDPAVTVVTGPEATRLRLPVVTAPRLAGDTFTLGDATNGAGVTG